MATFPRSPPRRSSPLCYWIFTPCESFLPCPVRPFGYALQTVRIAEKGEQTRTPQVIEPALRAFVEFQVQSGLADRIAGVPKGEANAPERTQCRSCHRRQGLRHLRDPRCRRGLQHSADHSTARRHAAKTCVGGGAKRFLYRSCSSLDATKVEPAGSDRSRHCCELRPSAVRDRASRRPPVTAGQ